MTWQERIGTDPGVLAGKPTIKGTRIAVELVQQLRAQGWSDTQLLAEYPRLTPRDLAACTAFEEA